MKKFIRQILYFFAPIILLSYGIDVFLSKNLRKSNTGENPIWRDIIEGKVNKDILIAGSSRALLQLDPKLFTDSLHHSTYNLGLNGHNFWLQYLRHKMLLQHNHKPQLIIHSMDVFTFQKKSDLYNADQFLPYMLFNKDIMDATISYDGYKKYDYVIPLVRYYGKKDAILTALLLAINKTSNKFERIDGFKGENRAWTGDLKEAEVTLGSLRVKIDTPSVNLFDKYIRECRQNNIKLIFVYTPEYIEGQSFIKNRKQIFDIFHAFSTKYNIPFYDYSNDSISYKTDYFFNSLHLNKTGAELFTKKFIVDLKGHNDVNFNQ